MENIFLMQKRTSYFGGGGDLFRIYLFVCHFLLSCFEMESVLRWWNSVTFVVSTAQRRNSTFMRFSCFALSRVFSLPSTDTPKNSSYVCIPASSIPFFCVFFTAIQSFSLYTFSCALNRRIRCPFGRKVFSLPYDLRWSEMCSSLSLMIWSTCRGKTAFTFPILYHCDLARPLHQMNKGTHLIFPQALIFF